MTLLLASVRNQTEADMVVAGGADIVDLKDPTQGSLGMVAPETGHAIAEKLYGKVLVSATTGDIPFCHNSVLHHVSLWKHRVDFIKVGMLTRRFGHAEQKMLSQITALSDRIVLVLFADYWPEGFSIPIAIQSGVVGVVLDTFDKNQGKLTEQWSWQKLAAFVETVHTSNMFCALAGSITHKDVGALLDLNVDILGFRSSLCEQGKRIGTVSSFAIAKLRNSIPLSSDSKDSRLNFLEKKRGMYDTVA